jgi:hypothetical protein
MVNKRLNHILEDRGLLPDTQYGFQKGIEGFIAEAIRKREYAALSLGISKAYDTCRRLGIIRKLKDWKIDGKNLVHPLIGNTYSKPREIENRAVLSVTLFLVAMAQLCRGIVGPTRILGYADDWVILTSNKYTKNSRDYRRRQTRCRDRQTKWQCKETEEERGKSN